MTPASTPQLAPAQIVARQGLGAQIRCPINDDDVLDVRIPVGVVADVAGDEP